MGRQHSPIQVQMNTCQKRASTADAAKRQPLHHPAAPPAGPHLVQVCLHELKHDVDVLVVAGVGGQHDVLDLHNVCQGLEAGASAAEEGWVMAGSGVRGS